MKSVILLLSSGLVGKSLVQAAAGPWAQCGGNGYSGDTTCQSGWHCEYANEWYSQCLEGSGSGGGGTGTTTTKPPTTTSTSAPGRKPTIYLCGDSTMAKGGGGSGTEGWGQYLAYSFDSSKATVVNKAIGGRSARSYHREGRFSEVANLVQPGDWVVMEFGHNDGGSLKNDNGRTDCFGAGEETCPSTYNGQSELVHTFPWYLKQGAQAMIAKGAKVVFSSATPNNVWESGTWGWGPDRFFYYTWLAADQLGGPPNAYFVPHGQYSAQAMKNLGRDTVNANYPNDHTHTGPYLADVMSRAFVLGLKCGTTDLGSRAKNATRDLTSTFLGPCITNFNSTVSGLLR